MSAASFLALVRDLSRLPAPEYHARLAFYAAQRHAYYWQPETLLAAHLSDNCVLATDWEVILEHTQQEWPLIPPPGSD